MDYYAEVLKNTYFNGVTTGVLLVISVLVVILIVKALK